MKVVYLFIAGLLLTVGSLGHAQTRERPTRWRVFSPTGKGFRIEVPAKPHRIDDLSGDTNPNGYKSIDVYGVSQSSPIRREYQIIVLVSSEGMRKEHPNGNELGGLEFTIGGDNAEPTSQSDIKIGNFKGKELVYALTDAQAFGHRKGQIIDAGTKIFILLYATNTASDLSSSAAVRFFNSFKVI